MFIVDVVKLVATLQKLYPFWKGGAGEMRAIQERSLRAMLAHAAQNSPYYRRRFNGIDLTRCAIGELPVLTKAELMENFDALVTDPRVKKADLQKFVSDAGNLGKLYLGQYGVSHTSGSQGQPAIIVQDPHSLMIALAARFTRGKNPGGGRLSNIHRLWKPARMAVLTVRPGFYPSSSAFAYRPPVLDRFFRILQLSITDPVSEIAAKIEAFRPEFITGYASALVILAREEEAGRMNLRKLGTLAQITNVAEPLPEPTAEYLERVFGVHVFNEYAMGECLAVASGCHVTHGTHHNADLSILEVVDENNRPVPPGRQGRKVLLTNLYNKVQPIIRYEIDDRVTFSAGPCACGGILPQIASIEGRSKDYAWVQLDGKAQELPYFSFLQALNHCIDVAEHQVVQTGENKIRLRVAPVPGKVLSKAELKSHIEKELAADGYSQLDLEIEIVPEIARGPSGKITRVKNEYGPMPV